MHTGIISFANRIVNNIKSNDIKDFILNQLCNLYNIKIIQKHYHKLDDNNIKYLKNNLHLCNLRSNGNPYYMFLTLYNDIPIIYFIDKKIHPCYQKPRIILTRGLFDISLYKNTLLDGEMIRKNNGKWVFIINDIISYEGNYLIKEQLPERLKIIYNLLEYKYTPDTTIDVCEYKVKTYYNLYQESINELIELSKKLDYTCRGIYLWSYDLKHKPKLYNFDENNIINVIRKVKDETEFKSLNNDIEIEKVKNETEQEHVIIKDEIICNDNEKILWIVKTDDPDVYNLYDNEIILSSKKIGIAFISNLSISKILRNSLKNKNVSSSVKCKCIYNNKFNKWAPIDVIL